MNALSYDETFYFDGDGIVTDIDSCTPKFYDKITKKNLDRVINHDYNGEPYFHISYEAGSSDDRRAMIQLLILRDKLERINK